MNLQGNIRPRPFETHTAYSVRSYACKYRMHHFVLLCPKKKSYNTIFQRTKNCNHCFPMQKQQTMIYTLHVHQTMVKNQNYKWVLKSVAKNSTSDRYVEYPDKVIKELPVSGKICNLNPDMITHDFGRTIKKLGLPHFRFHDLRHPYVKPTTKKFITFFEVFRAAS